MKHYLFLFLVFLALQINIDAQTLPVWSQTKVEVQSQNRDSVGLATLQQIAAIVATVNGSGTVTNVSGTTNRVTVTNNTTTPVVDIASTYVGQASITTLGTITTGTWNGTTVGVPYGGTGATTLTGILKGNGTSAFTAATAGTDYVVPSGNITGTASNVTGTVAVSNGGTGATTLTGYLKGNGTSAFTASSTLPTTDLSGTVTNAQLANSAITINGTSTSLGGTRSIDLASVTGVGATTATASTFSGGLTSSGTTTLSGAVINTQTATSSTTTLTASVTDVTADATSAAYTITLPACATGRVINIVRTNTNANNVTLTRNGSDTINSNTSLVIASAGLVKLIGIGTNWVAVYQ